MSAQLRCDVVVVGAGPAGATLATLLASRHVDVIVLDRDSFPRDKVCGEFLSYDAVPLLEELGLMQRIRALGAPAIPSCRIISAGGTYEFPLPKPAWGVSRMAFDSLLVAASREAGARCLEGHVATAMAPALKTVTIQKGDTTIEVAARVIVGAWGRWGRFDQQLGRAFVSDRRTRHFGFKKHFRAPAGRPETSVDLVSFEGGYLGISAVEGDQVNVCGLAHAQRISGLKGRWDAFVTSISRQQPHLGRTLQGLEPVQEEYLSSEPVIFRARAPEEQEVIMAGDAAGIVDPLTGNGMAMALQSAFLAAPFVLSRLAGGKSQGYTRAYEQFFSTRLAWSRRAAWLLSRPRLVDSFLSLAERTKVGDLLLRKTRAENRAVEGLLLAWQSTRS